MAEITYGLDMINAPLLWDESNEGEGVVVAVLDTGIDSTHPDLQGQVIGGQDFTGTGSYEDDDGHGTHVAGTIAALSNSAGVVGVAPKVKLLSYKIFVPEGGSQWDWMTNAVNAAVDWTGANGEKVGIINISGGGIFGTDALHDAIIRAKNAGIMIVCAAGNQGDDDPGTDEYYYPSYYPETISVGAVDANRNMYTSATSNDLVNIVAPGVEVYSTVPGGGYGYKTGTSMATPHITGSLALLWNTLADPTPESVTGALYNSCTDLGYDDNLQGKGLVNLGVYDGYVKNPPGPSPEPEPDPTPATSWGDLYRTEWVGIDWTSQRIQPRVEYKIPDEFIQEEYFEQEQFFITPYQRNTYDVKQRTEEIARNGWISYPLGVFLVATPKKKEEGSSISREIEAYDKLLILLEDRITERLTFTAGQPYYDCMVDVLESAGISKYSIENDGKVLETTKEYEPGKEKLRILNDLAGDLNFTQMYVDEYGYFRSHQYTTPSQRSVDYEYIDNEESVTFLGTEEELDMWDLPNVFHVTVSNPDRDTALSATAINDNGNHPRSVSNLGRRVVRFEEKDDIADQEALNAYVERIAHEASQIFGKVTFTTAIMPFHGYSNVLRVRNQTLGIDAKYSETDWTIPLEVGGQMQHSVRRTIDLS